MPTPEELFRRLADRGTERGADDVFARASSRAARPPALLIGAVVAVLALGAGVVLTVDRTDDVDDVIAAPPQRGADQSSTPDTVPGTLPGSLETTSETSPTAVPIDAGDEGVVPLDASAPVTTTLQSHASCGSVLDRITALALPVVGPYGLDAPVMVTSGGARTESSESSPQTAAAAPAPSDVAYSESNIQEAGVDEADLVKTDGTVLVVLARDRLQVLSIADRSLLATLELPAPAHALFLTDDTVIAIGSPVWDENRDGPESPITLVDISDPSAPTVRSTTWIEGMIRTSRLQNGVLRLVTADAPRFDWTYPEDGSKESEDRATAANRTMVEASTLDRWLPDYRTVAPDGSVVDTGPAASCQSTYTPTEESGFDTTTVVTLDPATGAVDPGTSITASPVVVYASPTSLYVVSTTWRGDRDGSMRSDLHRFDLTSIDAAPYRSSGSVPGFPVDQFALSERDGYLRIATTSVFAPDSMRPDSPRPGAEPERRVPETDSAVWVLAERVDELELVGHVDGLGEEGERIYSVRYHEDVAYVTTFRQTDPLYVIDLSDPFEPRVRSELHIPGFSTFLQHVGQGRLVGVGRDADEEGRVGGLQLSLFDVSDPTDPRRAELLTYDDGFSPAEHDHLAFLHWAPTDLVVVPLIEHDREDPCRLFAGALMVRLDGTTMRELGRISHETHAQDGRPAGSEDEGPRSRTIVPIMRSLVAGDSLLTVSSVGVAFGGLDDGAEEDFVDFEGPVGGVETMWCEQGPEPEPEPEPEPFPLPV